MKSKDTRKNARLRRRLLVLILVLYAVSVPWYREAGAEPAIWLGLPDWVTFAVLCYAVIAVLNAWAWSVTDFEDPDTTPETTPARGDA